MLFILALRGLSSPGNASRKGNLYRGMIGMAIAVGVTVLNLASKGTLDVTTIVLILCGIAVGGIAGTLIAQKVAMTQMPQLVAAFHSLVGMAACMVALGALFSPMAFGIDDGAGGIKTHVR